MGSLGIGKYDDDVTQQIRSAPTAVVGETEIRDVTVAVATQEFDSALSPPSLPGNDSIGDCCTQILDEFDTSVLFDSDALSDDGLLRRHSSNAVDERMWNDCFCKRNDKENIEGQDALTPMFHRFSPLLDSLRDSCQATCCKGTDSGSFSVLRDNKHPSKDTDVTVIRESVVRREFNQDCDSGKNTEKMKTFKENTGKFGCSAFRKLFAEDVEEPSIVFDTDCGGVYMDQPPMCDGKFAKLSYIDSKEPEEACQADALEFVDRYIEDNLAGLEQGIHDGKSTGGKSNPVSFAEGPQRLAMKASRRRMVGETRIYDFDEGLEDEGGGDILRRRKEDFFGVGGDLGEVSRHLTKQRKPRYAGLKGSRVVDMPSNIHGKIKGFVHSVFRSGLRSSKKVKPAPTAKRNITKNLINDFDEELEPKSFVGELNAADAEVDILDSVSLDTQLTKEAMEALSDGVVLATSDKRGMQNICKGSVEDPLKRKLRELNSREFCLRKRPQPPDALLSCARKSKKIKRTGSNLNDNLSISPLKGCKKASILYQYDSEFVKSSRKRVNAEKCAAPMESENMDEMDINAGSKFSARHISVKKGSLQEEISTYTPIAHRTRRRSMLTHSVGSDANSREENDDPMEAGFVKGKRKSKRDGTAITAANTKPKSADLYSNKPKNVRNNLSSDQCRDLQSVEKNWIKQLHPKFTDVTNYSAGHGLSHLRGRTCQISSGPFDKTGSQVDLLSVEQETGLYSTMLRRSKSDVNSKYSHLETKRKMGLSFDKISKAANKSDEKTSNDLGGPKAFKLSDKENDIDSAALSAGPDVFSSEEREPSDVACSTPIGRKKPAKLGSPICMGDEYFKQSCNRKLSRSSLIKELNSLSVTSSEPTSALGSLRKRKDINAVRVLFSCHLDEETVKRQEKIMSRLGASMASSISDATHFVTDEFVRTRNMLEAIASGKPVVTHSWLESCGQTSCFVDEKYYILRDSRKEKELGFSMPVSLACACSHPLLKGRRVLITPHTKPGKEIITSLVKAVQGRAIERIGRSLWKDDKISDDLLILSCEDDYAICLPFIERGATVYSSELLLNGVVTQKLDYARHCLFVDRVRRTRSTTWLKKDSNQLVAVAKQK